MTGLFVIATHSSIHAWKIPWTEEPAGLKSMGSQRVGHDWVTSLSLSLHNVFFNIFYLITKLWVKWKGGLFSVVFIIAKTVPTKPESYQDPLIVMAQEAKVEARNPGLPTVMVQVYKKQEWGQTSNMKFTPARDRNGLYLLPGPTWWWDHFCSYSCLE